MRITSLFSVVCALASAIASADSPSIAILPPQTVLNGKQALQRLLVERTKGGVATGDLTAKAKFVSSNPQVVRVTAEGTLRAVGNGSASITATVEGRKATSKVLVQGVSSPRIWSFRNHVLPALTKAACNSGACHGAAAGKGGLKLTLRGYDPESDYNVLTRQAGGRRVVSGEPQSSLLLLKPAMQIPHGGGKRIAPNSPDYALLSEWIKQGTPQPTPKDPQLERLEVFPAFATLKTGDNQQILVRARYSDGRAEDVTRWVKFGTSESSVATVDDSGNVKATGNGEAAITVWFSSKVTFARIASPFPNAPTPETFAKAARSNFVDDLVLQKLKALGIPPSPPASDSTFLRRAFLDACGVLPAPQEALAFLKDTSPNKRAKLVESLLARPEFVDYWTYKWSDLLLVSSRKLPGAALTSFSNWIRKSVQENRRWDQFAREILTAQGSTLENGAANYFVLHKEPTELTETTTQAFMGMSLTCARCHNHPLEKWTQSQYYEMANLFSRVRLKNGERGGDVQVIADAAGEINHPRRGVPLPPRPLDGNAVSLADTRDRREALADWLTAPKNPYFAKALVNRVWRNFLGRGVVEAEDDLRLTNPPSNQELLDGLAQDFTRSGYDVKHLIRTIMLSATYQRDSDPVPGNEKDDRYYSRYLPRRLPAEVILDAMSQATGVPTAFEGYAKGSRALQLPDSQVASYFLTAFGRPERAQTCACERQQEPSIAQALHLANGDTLNMKLRASGGAIDQLLNAKYGEAIEAIYLAGLSRTPTATEKARLLTIFQESVVIPRNRDEQNAFVRGALEDLFWAVLTGKEFLFNH